MKSGKLLSTALAIILLFSLLAPAGLADEALFAEGEGTLENPYLIATAEDFLNIKNNNSGDNSGVYYRQTADIVLGSYEPFTFNGNYSGGSYSVEIALSGAHRLALFSELYGTSSVSDLTVEGTVTAWGYGGSVAATVASDANVTIENVVNNATISGSNWIGGIVGDAYLGSTGTLTVNNAVNNGAVTATNSAVGGLAARAYYATFTSCKNTGKVTLSSAESSSVYVGGLVGIGRSYFAKCLNTGDIKSATAAADSNGIGGILGVNNASITITDCFNSGAIDATGNVGGIIGTAGANQSGPSIRTSYTTTGVPVGNILSGGAIYGASVYYFASEEADTLDVTTALAEDKRTDLANYSGFSSDVWFLDFDGTGYEYPQIVGNEIEIIRGTKENPYLIASAEDFMEIGTRENAGVYYKQTADINLGNYTPFTFSGYYDGGNKTVTLALEGGQYLSLFSELSGTVEISNLTVEGSVYAYTRAASIANNIAAGSTVVISDIVNNAAITGDNDAGGIVCRFDSATGSLNISSVVNNGNITVHNSNKYAGGIIAYGRAVVTECLNTGDILTKNADGTTVSGAGGIMGGNRTSAASVTNCYNTGEISVGGNVGGIIGAAGVGSSGPSAKNSYTTTGVPVGTVVTGGNISGENLYYFASEEADSLDITTALAEADRTDLTKYTGFSDTVWMIDYDATGYKYPQLINLVIYYEFGTEENPYEISDEQDFIDMEAKLGENKYFVITENITLSSAYQPYAFTNGNLNGNNHAVSLNIESTEDYTGLFTEISGSSVIENLTVEGSVSGVNYVGALAGRITAPVKVTVKNCVNKAEVNASGARVGGFIGDCYESTLNNLTVELTGLTNEAAVSGAGYWVGGITGITTNGLKLTNMINTGSITGGNSAGGIVGLSYGDISTSYNTGTVTAPCAGGIAGYTVGSAEIDSCFNTGNIVVVEDSTGETGAGGILGKLGGTASKVTNCYDAGALANADEAIVSWYDTNGAGTIENCYYLNPAAKSGKEGTTPKTAEELKAVELGENFVITENSYPQLRNMPAVTPETLYVLTVAIGENGSCDAETRYVKAGDSVTITATGAEGYETSAVYVNGSAVEHSGGVYTISDINSDTAYSAEFVKTTLLTVAASVFNGSELTEADYLLHNISIKYSDKNTAIIFVSADGNYRECGFTIANGDGSYSKTIKTESNEAVMIVSENAGPYTVTPYVIDTDGVTFTGEAVTVFLSAME